MDKWGGGYQGPFMDLNRIRIATDRGGRVCTKHPLLRIPANPTFRSSHRAVTSFRSFQLCFRISTVGTKKGEKKGGRTLGKNSNDTRGVFS